LLIFYSAFSRSQNVKVGVYYYVWYDGTKHSNIVDNPILGWPNYWSNNSNVINMHLKWFEELDLDFIIISWWWIAGVGPKQLEDSATKAVFEAIKNREVDIEVAIMVESENKTASFNYTKIYKYIYDNYVSKYSEIYMKPCGKPLLCFFNGESLTKNGNIPLDNRFEIRIVGDKSYADWKLDPEDIRDGNPTLTTDGVVTIFPRYDITYWNNASTPIDPNLTEQIYDKEWSKILNLTKQGKIRYVLIHSWNEYAERTHIEPAYDNATRSPNSPQTENAFYLFNKTKSYIKQLKSVTPRVLPPKLLLIIMIAIIVIIGAASALIRLIILKRQHSLPHYAERNNIFHIALRVGYLTPSNRGYYSQNIPVYQLSFRTIQTRYAFSVNQKAQNLF